MLPVSGPRLVPAVFFPLTSEGYLYCQGHAVLMLLLLLLLSHFSRVRLFATPWTVAYQAPQSMGFSRQEHWSGLPFPSPTHEREK